MKIEYDKALAKQIETLRKKLRQMENSFDDDAMARNNLQRGTVVRNRHTKALYEITHLHVSTSTENATIVAHRVYKSGRRAARTASYLSMHDMELSDE